METVLTTNNGQMAWVKLSTFGLHNRRGFIGWNRYQGKNSEVFSVDPISGMKIAFYPAKAPHSERASRYHAVKVPGKLGRPAIFSHPMQAREPLKRGRKPLTAEQKAEREAIKAELSGLVFFGPARKRGPKAGTVQTASNTGKKRGRISEADRIKAAKKGDVIQSKNGSWLMIEDGLASWIAA